MVKYGYPDDEKLSDKQVTLLIRNSYIAHPRASGEVDRTVHDNSQTEAALRLRYPNDDQSTISFEDKTFAEQPAIIRKTDLLVTVHGAGNVHVLFLPLNSSFIEFYPNGFEGR